MCFDTYKLIDEIVKFVIYRYRKKSGKEIKNLCKNELFYVIKKWSEGRKDYSGNKFVINDLEEKTKNLLLYYFDFKKNLSFEMKSNVCKDKK